MRRLEFHSAVDQPTPYKVEVSKPPIFDTESAYAAREISQTLIRDYVTEKDLPYFQALNNAVALSFYNFLLDAPHFPTPVRDHHEKRLVTALHHLIQYEIQTANLSNTLPTIGIEVEIPRIPYLKIEDRHEKYKNFSNVIGLPVNAASSSEGWEFAPPPSYAAKTQSQILSELIKGGFIAHLKDSQDPNDIFHYLDSTKLVSLHVNLGVLKGKYINNHNAYAKEMFSLACALAFSSPLRLEKKRMDNIHSLQSDVVPMTEHNNKGYRLELKALEVRDESVYRAMSEIQVLGAALFDYYKDPSSVLGSIWQNTQHLLSLAFSYENSALGTQKINKYLAATLAKNRALTMRIRKILDTQSLVVKHTLAESKSIQ